MIRREQPLHLAAALQRAREAPLVKPGPLVAVAVTFVAAEAFAFTQELRVPAAAFTTLLFGLVVGKAWVSLRAARDSLISNLERAPHALLCFRDLAYGIVFVDERGVFIETSRWLVPWSSAAGKPRLTAIEYDAARHALVVTVINMLPPSLTLTLPSDISPQKAETAAAHRPAQSLQTTLP